MALGITPPEFVWFPGAQVTSLLPYFYLLLLLYYRYYHNTNIYY